MDKTGDPVAATTPRAGSWQIWSKGFIRITHLALLMGQPIIFSREQLAETGDLYKNIYGQK